MLDVSLKARDSIFICGVVLFVGGILLALVSLRNFEALPNYLRVGSLLPFSLGVSMLHIDAYRKWHTLSAERKRRPLASLITSIMLLVGFAVWWLAAPEVRG
jgi:hypothetical protein